MGHKGIRFPDSFMLKKDTVASGYCDTLTHSQRSNTVTEEYCNALLSFSHSFLFGQERRRRSPKFKIADSWKEIYSLMLYSIIRKIWTFFPGSVCAFEVRARAPMLYHRILVLIWHLAKAESWNFCGQFVLGIRIRNSLRTSFTKVPSGIALEMARHLKQFFKVGLSADDRKSMIDS